MPESNIVPFQPRPESILRIIREIAQDSDRIRLGPAMPAVFSHGYVSFRQILNCLKKGVISEGPYMDEFGLTVCEIEAITAGRKVRVVVSIEGRTPVDRVLHVLFAEEL